MDIRTKDGNRIWINVYSTSKVSNKLIIVAPCGGLTKEYYDPLAVFLQQQDYTVIVLEYRGTGSSAPNQLKGCDASLHQWAVQDIDAVILYAKNNFPRHEIIFLGHAIGGEIVGLAQASQYISKLVLINSALSSRKLWSFKDKFRILGWKRVVWMIDKIFGYFPGKRLGHSADIPKGVMYEWACWCSNPNGLFDAFPDTNYRKLHIPLLAFSFSDDWHCPPNAVKELLNHFSNAAITWYHMRPKDLGVKKVCCTGFFEQTMQSELWVKMLRWLNEDAQMKVSVNIK